MNSFKLGEWSVICDRCGWSRLSSQVVETWDGLIVCSPRVKDGCFETRHPQDFIRSVKDDSSVPFVRSRPTDVYVDDIPSFNCATAEEVAISNNHVQNRGTAIINKGRSIGPITVIETVVTVNCTWIID